MENPVAPTMPNHLPTDLSTTRNPQYAEGVPEALLTPRHQRNAADQANDIRSDCASIHLPKDLYRQLEQLAKQHQVTLLHVLLGALYLYFTRIGQRDDFAIGLSMPSLAKVTNPFWFRFGQALSFAELLGEIDKVLGYRHQPAPLDTSDTSGARLFDVSLSFVQQDDSHPLLHGQEQTPLQLFVRDLPTQSNAKIDFAYHPAYFRTDEIERLQACLLTILQNVLTRAEQPIQHLPILPPAQIAQLKAWNDTQTEYPQDQTIVGLFEQQAAQTPHNMAVVCADQQLTYAQLNQQANQLAHHLIEQGVQADTLVGLCVEPSLEVMVGLLGILKAGGAYVPLDPAYPAERLRFMLEDSRVGLLLTQRCLQNRLPLIELETTPTLLCLDEPGLCQKRPTTNPTPCSTPKDMAYIIYTSGSTGRPKGVLISQGNLLHSTRAREHYYPEPVTRFLLLSSLAFDSSVAGIFWTLLTGGALVLPKPGEEKVLDRLIGLIAQHQITHTLMVPGLYHLALQHKKATLQSLQAVIVAGETCAPNLLRLHQNTLPATTLYNEYGPTEGAVWCTAYRIPAHYPGSSVPIGAPIANTRIYILDKHQQPLPVGIPGELCIAGAGLARGYLNCPELTAEKFINVALFGQTERIYTTGDLARWLPDGNLEYLGRIDHQIKLRGYRIELGEIEAALTQQAGIEQSLVICTDHMGDKRLIAYIIPHADHLAAKTELTAQLHNKLGKQLPGYMVPSAFVVLDRFPLTPNGKVDRKALPIPAMQGAYVAPRNAAEEKLAAIWADVLGVEQVGIQDNFFALGGHSLLAMQLVSQLHEKLGVKLPLQQLFNRPTIAQLSLYLQQPADQPPAAESSAFPTIENDLAARHAPFPLNDIQQAYWLGREPGVTLGNVTPHFYQEVDGPLFDVARLQQTWQRLVERHEMLRTIVLADGQQQILPQVPAYAFVQRDLSGYTEQVKQQALATIRQALSDRMFDPTQWPLFDIRVTQLDAATCRLHFTLDILVADGWSFSILSHEWWQLYQNPSIELEPLELSFRDYVLAEQNYRQQAAGTAYQNALHYWRQRIANLPPGPQLPLARLPESLDKPSFSARSFKFNAGQWRQFKQKIAAANITPSTLLLTVYADILALWAKSAHFTLNLTLFNRLPVHAQINRVVGDFTSLILLEIDQCEPGPLIERVRRVQQQLWEDLNHRSVSAVQVLRDMATQNNQHDFMPVVFTSLLVLDTEQDQSLFTRLGEQAFALGCTPQVWLDNVIMEDPDGVEFFWFSVDELFPAGLLDSMFAAYQQHIEQLLHEDAAWQVSDVQHLLPATHLTMQRTVNATQTPSSSRFIHSLFDEQVAQQTDRTALISGTVELSYPELHAKVLQLAHWLRQQGVGRNDRVAVVMDKGWEQVVAVLGIAYAGGAYVPIDAEQPESRQHLLLHETDAQVVLTQAKWRESLNFPQNIPILALDQQNLPLCDYLPELVDRELGDLAYIIYTSGSTGKPKGVAIDHRGAVNTLEDINRRFRVNEQDRVLALSALNFDLSVYDIFGVLGAGGALVMPDPAQRREPQHWANLMEQHQVTLWNTVPALMQMLVDHGAPSAAPLRLVMLSGDWIPLSLPERIQQNWPTCQTYSLGGATEASIWSIYYPIERVDHSQNSIPYGKPMDSQTFWVLDDHLQPRPTWATGNLYIGGIGLAQGYWNDKAKTAASFIIHPETGERLYKTGDLGRWLPDGNIEFMGREDTQVKVRGHRIELGEIEAVLNQHPAVGAAVVVLHQREGSPALAAYIASATPLSFPHRRESRVEDEDRIDSRLRGNDGAFICDLRAWLAERLPDYMIPASFTLLDALPLTSNGKVDRKALPEPDSLSGARSSIPPRDLLELRLLQAWQDVLPVKDIHVHDNFFELGGHSLLAVRLMQQIKQQFDRKLPISLLFQHPSIAQLADILRDEHQHMGSSNCIAINTPTDATAPAIFLLPGTIGSVLYLQPLAAALGDQQALYALQTPGLHDDETTPETIQALAIYHITALRDQQPNGPYYLVGHSSGGRVAFEMAHQLEQQGESIALLGILDANAPDPEQSQQLDEDTDAYWLWSLILVFEELSGLSFDTSLDALHALPVDEAYDRVLHLCQQHELFTAESDRAELRRWVQVYRATTLGHATYQTQAKLDCPIHLFRAQERSREPDTESMFADQRPDWGWSAHTTRLHTHATPGSHVTMMTMPQVQQLADLISAALENGVEAGKQRPSALPVLPSSSAF